MPDRWPGLPDPCAIRPRGGLVHVAVPTGRGYATACNHGIRSPHVEVFLGLKRDLAWQYEERCADCEALTRRGYVAVITGLYSAWKKRRAAPRV